MICNITQYIIQYDIVQCCTIQRNTTQYNTKQFNTIKQNIQYNKTQYKFFTTQYNAVHCNVIQHYTMLSNTRHYNAMYNAIQCNMKYDTIHFTTPHHTILQFEHNTTQHLSHYHALQSSILLHYTVLYCKKLHYCNITYTITYTTPYTTPYIVTYIMTYVLHMLYILYVPLSMYKIMQSKCICYLCRAHSVR